MDLVTHDLRKFVRLMLRRNGYVLEQLLSPLVVHTTDVHREDEAQSASMLPDAPAGYDALHDLVVRVRLED